MRPAPEPRISAEAIGHVSEWYRVCGIDQPKRTAAKPARVSKAVRAKTTEWKKR